MRVSTYKRHLQAEHDHANQLRSKIDAKFKAAGLTADCGGYPINPDEETAFKAGFQRGCHWAHSDAMEGKPVTHRWDMADSTAAGSGEQAGWNAAAAALAVKENAE